MKKDVAPANKTSFFISPKQNKSLSIGRLTGGSGAISLNADADAKGFLFERGANVGKTFLADLLCFVALGFVVVAFYLVLELSK